MPESNPISSAVPGVLGLAPYQPGKPVEELERELGISSAIKLASNENPWGPSPLAVAALRESSDQIGFYPDANGFALKEKLSERLGIDPLQITLGNGSNDVLDLVARAFVEPGDEVIYSQYAFLVYALVTQATGGRAVVVPAVDWGHDLDAMAQSVTVRTKVVFLANPNNPTGTFVDQTALIQFLDRVPRRVIVVLDEAYFEYVIEASYPNGIELLHAYENLVVTRTFSKAYGLAGLRVGYGVASAAISDILNRVRQPFNVSGVAQSAALAALEDNEHIVRSRDENTTGKRYLCESFENLGIGYIPSVANFVTIELGSDASRIYEELLRRGIIVRPIANYAMLEHLRVTIGRGRDNEALTRALAETRSA